MIKKIIILVFYIIFNFQFSSFAPVNAAHEFTTSYNSTYEVLENGLTKVTQNISLINQTTQYRPSKYILEIKSPDINKVSAYDKGGVLQLKVTKDQDKTVIEAIFNDIVVGKNNSLNWTLYYETSEYAQKVGKVWEIDLPGFPETEDIISYNVKLIVPQTFGNLIYSSPKSQTPFSWTMAEIGKQAISVMFGNSQTFSLFLRYHLLNKNNYPVRTEIALPLDTSYQTVSLDSISPLPLDVLLDVDGNWLAQYNLRAKENLTVKVSGLVNLSFLPEKQNYLTSTQKILYTKSQKYWPVDDPEIIALAKKLKTPENIYQYVVDTLTYDYSKIANNPIKRLGAKGALANPKNAICVEFTDLFIAIARAAKIPAREVDGYAYTTNSRLKPLSLEKDVLHAWPEYYDEASKFWLQVDPTWSNTTNGVDYFHKLDLNHIAFVTKGENSEYPVPAGSYRQNYDEKDVNVDIYYQDFISNRELTKTSISLPEKILAGFTYQGKVNVQNISGRNLSKIILSKSSTDIIFPSDTVTILENIPPFANREILFNFKSNSYFDNKEGKIEFTTNNQNSSKLILIRPLILDTIGIVILGGILGITIIIILITKYIRRLSLQRQERENSLRGESQKP